jgi:hypothetical protein
MIEHFKNLHRQIFKEDFIEQHYAIFDHIFKFWGSFTTLALDLKKTIKPALIYISSWESLSADIEIILKFKAVASDTEENCFNLFLLS